jgi:hypothetical protein
VTGESSAGGIGAWLVTAVVLALLAGTCAAVAQAPSGPEPTEERRFWVNDAHHYRSPWYRGTHRRMINYGCTRAPYYPPDPRCADDRGFHHGVDIAMGCGTLLTSAVRGRVVRPRSAGALGPAYGSHAFRIRNPRRQVDIVIGHVGRVFSSGPGTACVPAVASPEPPTSARQTAATCTSRCAPPVAGTPPPATPSGCCARRGRTERPRRLGGRQSASAFVDATATATGP